MISTSTETAARPDWQQTASVWTNTRHVVRTRFVERPRLYLPFARRRYPGPSPRVIGPETEVVIEGYNRSANTFSVYAFQLAQPRPVRVAHHLHAPAQVIAAVRSGIPTIVVIRDPRGAVLSQVVREPHVSMRYALWAYVRFYKTLLAHRPHFVVGDFEQTTSDFGGVVRRLNAMFGTSFAEFIHSEDNLRRCRELMDQRPVFGPHLDPASRLRLAFESGEATAAELEQLAPPAGDRRERPDSFVPSSARRHAKAALEREWEHPRLGRLRAQAHEMHAAFTASG